MLRLKCGGGGLELVEFQGDGERKLVAAPFYQQVVFVSVLGSWVAIIESRTSRLVCPGWEGMETMGKLMVWPAKAAP